MHKKISHTTCPPRPRPPDLWSVLYRGQHTENLILRAWSHLTRAIPGAPGLRRAKVYTPKLLTSSPEFLLFGVNFERVMLPLLRLVFGALPPTV